MRAIVVVPAKPSWSQGGRGPLFVEHMQRAGYKATLFTTKDFRYRFIDDGFDAVFFHALTFQTAQLTKYVRNNPQTQFVTVNHSCLPHLENSPHALWRYTTAIHLARRYRNVWCTTRDENGIGYALGNERICCMASPVVEPEQLQPREVFGDPVRLAIAGRDDMVKCNSAALVACKMLAKTRNVQVLSFVENSKNLRNIAKAIDLDVDEFGCLEHTQWLKKLDTVDVLLQTSVAESFNVCAVEAMSRGVPVVAGPGVKTRDPSLVATDPSNPHTIYEALCNALFNYAENSAYAIAAATSAINEQNNRYRQFLELLRAKSVSR